MWWLLKEPFLATYSVMLNLNLRRPGKVAPKRAFVFNILLRRLVPPPCVFCTLFRRDFLRPERLETIHQFLLVAWLHLRFQEELEFMPQVFYRVEIWTFRGMGTPPVDIFSSKKAFARLDVYFGSLSCMNRRSGSFSLMNKHVFL